MRTLTAIADDLTGACDVGAELAAAGHHVRVVVAPDGRVAGDEGAIVIVNTQSRALPAAEAAGRVRAALAARRADVVLKKIDTALRGHLGAELDAAITTLAAPVFVLAAIPAAGRVTRGGCQWFGERPLAATEFARDPEGAGAESSIPTVIARESGRGVAVLGREVAVDAGRLAAAVERGRRAGVDVFVLDAETDADVVAAVAAVLALPPPVCLAGSIALAAALARHREPGSAAAADGERIPLPALIVNGSLHSRAREQAGAAIAAGRAIAVPLPPAGEADAGARVAAAAAAALAAGASVVLAPATPGAVPDAGALRATERGLAAAVRAIAERTRIPSLVLIGGETSYAVLTALAAETLAITGRMAPLIASGTIVNGVAAGTVLVTKGGSGGEPDAIARLLGAELGTRAKTAGGRS